MNIFNTQAKRLNYIAEHGICMSDRYKNTCRRHRADRFIKDETMFHPWMKVKYTFIQG
jgi:hypothetical protein